MSVTRRTTLRALGAAGATLAVSGTVLGVGEHDDDEREPDDDEDDEVEPVEPAAAAVRVAHFSPDAPNVDVYVDGDQVLTDLAYDEVSEYLSIEPGTYTVEVTAAGDPETVAFEGDVEIGQAFYTIAAIGELEAGTFEPLVLVDAGAALARLVHGSPDAPAVDVFPAGADEPLFANVAFGDATDYVPLPVGTYELEVRPAADEPLENATDDAAEAEDDREDHDDTKDDRDEVEDDHDDAVEDAIDEVDEAVFTVSVDLAPGTAYTGYAIGYLMPDADQPQFDVNVTVDGPFGDEEAPDVVPEEVPPTDEPAEEEPDEPAEEEPDEPDADEPEEEDEVEDPPDDATDEPETDDEENGA